jgi:hypothetical protein
MNTMNKALNLLRTCGWTKGNFYALDGSYCVLGALSCVAVTSEEVRVLQAVIKEQFPDRGIHPGISFFNDAPETTFAEVEMVLEKASMQLEESV